MNKYTESIDNYLHGRMSASEKEQFEQSLLRDTELRAEFELQQQLLKGIKQAGMRNELQRGLKKAYVKAKIRNWGTALLITGLTVAVVLGIKNKATSPADKEPIRYEKNETNQKQWSDADKNLSPQIFRIKGNRDTVIESKGGILFTLPANAFLNTAGQAVTGDIEIEVKEALNPLDIIAAGLSTTSNGDLLETGGMFYLNARKDKENLTIAKNKGIYTSIPNLQSDKEMLLFEGQRTADNRINWVNPRVFEKKLKPVNILSLDFYPPHFLDSLKAIGFNIKNKKLTDSVYYSFVCEPAAKPVLSEADSFAITPTVNDGPEAITLLSNANYIAPRSQKIAKDTLAGCEINPSRIRAIWDPRFNNTLLATKEFQERMQTIFKTCNPNVLNLYIENMNKKMYVVDSMASVILNENETGGFHKFYLRRDGLVSIDETHMKKLYAYMEEKQKLYKEQTQKALRDLYEKENAINQKVWQTRMAQQLKEGTLKAKTFTEELHINMTEAYRQLGKTKPIIPPYFGNYLSIPIVITGWYNVDRYVVASTVNRKTLNYTDKDSNKKAVIHYVPLNITVSNSKDYDRVVAYLLPDKLSSFQRMREVSKGFNENLNELLQYSLLVVGFKGEIIHGFKMVQTKPGNLNVSLSTLNTNELKQFKTSNNSALTNILEDIDFQLFEQKETARSKVIAKREEIRTRLWPVVFPCISHEVEMYN